MNNYQSKEHIKQLVLEILKTERPKNVSQLIAILQETEDTSEIDVTNILNDLSNEGKVKLHRKTAYPPHKNVYLTIANPWYWAVMAIMVASILSIFLPGNFYPLVYIRAFAGLVFTLFLPGFVFIKAIYPKNNPVEPSREIDQIERFVLSIGLSLSLTSIVGLALYYTPFGFGVSSITLALTILTAVLSNVALLREH
jgi:hypothetical protein